MVAQILLGIIPHDDTNNDQGRNPREAEQDSEYRAAPRPLLLIARAVVFRRLVVGVGGQRTDHAKKSAPECAETH